MPELLDLLVLGIGIAFCPPRRGQEVPELLDLLVLGIGIAFWPPRRGQEVPELLDLLVFSVRDRAGARARVKRCRNCSTCSC